MPEITACTMDCPDACSLIVSVDADGKLTIRGNPDHPVTSGFVCQKIQKHARRLQSAHRILFPQLRRGDGWQTVSWDDALDLCARKIQEFRQEPASILHIHGEGSKGVLKQAGKLFFSLLGASRTRGSLCDAAGYVAYLKDFGSRDNNDIRDLLNTAAVINWGKDLSRSSIHTAAFVRKARRQGAKVLSISPGGDGNAEFSDAQVRIRPGTDRFLAAAVIRRFIETDRIPDEILQYTRNWDSFKSAISPYSVAELTAACGLSSGDVDKVYAFYAGPDPVATLLGAGLQRYGYGGENVRFINALAMISGNIGRSGGGSYFHHHSLRNLNLQWAKAAERTPRRSLQMPLIGSEIRKAVDPPIRMLWVDGSNVINQAPASREVERAFQAVEFKVVVDAFMTDTAEQADLLLPCTLMLEQEDIVSSYMHDFIHHVSAVLKAPGQAASDFWILSQLGRRLTPHIMLPEADTCFRASLDAPSLETSLEALRKSRCVQARQPQVAFAGLRFAHADGKYRFPLQLHPEPAPKPEFPYRLLTLIRRGAIHSQIAPEEQVYPPKVWIAPECAAWNDLDHRKSVFLVSPVGRLRVKLEALPGLHPQVVLYRRGDWMKLGGGANQLITAGLSDMGKEATYYDQYVRLENR